MADSSLSKVDFAAFVLTSLLTTLRLRGWKLAAISKTSRKDSIGSDDEHLDQALQNFREMMGHLPQKDTGEPDWAKCRSDKNIWEKLKGDVNTTNSTIVAPTYDAAWQFYGPHDILMKTLTSSVGKFPADGNPRCVIEGARKACSDEEKEEMDATRKGDRDDGGKANADDDKIEADVNALLDLAAEHGYSLHQAIEDAVKQTNGAYYRGPTKKFERIFHKAKYSYKGDARRVVDIERGTGIYDSSERLAEAVDHLMNSGLSIVRVKDKITQAYENTNYRDIKFSIMSNGLVGELQLNFRKMNDLNKKVHCVYEMERVVNDEKYMRVPPQDDGLASVPMLRLTPKEGASQKDSLSLRDLQDKLDDALPSGCVCAGAYHSNDAIMVWLGVKSVKALAALRDKILLDYESEFKKKLDPLCIDVGAFVDLYATNMMKFTKLTLHQKQQLQKIHKAEIALLLAPAGGGKTFVAVQRMLTIMQQGGNVLFAVRNLPLALFVIRWLVIASRKKADAIVDNIRILIDGDHGSFADGPRRVQVTVGNNGRQLLQMGDVDKSFICQIAVVDEAHHIATDEDLREQLRNLKCKYLFLGDLSQGCSKNKFNEESVRSILGLPTCQPVVAKLTEVVRSTKRIVNGAAAFQLAAASKKETETHAASVGPALQPYLFSQVSADQRFRMYADHVVKALKAVEKKLGGANLDDRVMIVCPNDKFVDDLRGPLEEALCVQTPDPYTLISALEASAALPQDVFEAPTDRPRWLVIDAIERVDGLERLVVVATGLDNEIKNADSDFHTRSALYRALTRAQLAVAVVNEHVRGGWLEFLGSVNFDQSTYDDFTESHRSSSAPADKILVKADENAPVIAEEVKKSSTKLEFDSITVEADNSIGEVKQSIWDTRLIAKGTVNETPLNFMPFENALSSVNNMAAGYDEQGNYEKALESYEVALKGKVSTLGKDHPSALQIVSNMAGVCEKQGKYDKALELYGRALEGNESALGRNHPQTLDTVNNMAIVYENQGKYDEALEWFGRALKGYDSALGKDHPDTLMTVNSMAGVYDNQGEYDKALEWYGRALKGYESALGKDHPSTLMTVNSMAGVYDNQGEYDKALEWYTRALTGRESSLGRDHPHTLATVNSMAIVYYNQGEYDKALEWFGRALKWRESSLGKDHPDTLRMVSNMAIVYNKQGGHDKALELYGRALEGNESALGRNHPQTLMTVNSMARMYENQGEYDKALEWYTRALTGRDLSLGRDHPDTLDTVNSMAGVYENQGEYDKALEFYERALKGFEAALGKDHSATLRTGRNMAICLQNAGRKGELRAHLNQYPHLREKESWDEN